MIKMVMVYADKKKLVLEMLAKGREFADHFGKTLTAVLIGEEDNDLEDYIHHGADEVINVKTDQETFKAEEYSQILTQLIEEKDPEVILIGSNKDGKEMAPRIAAKFDTGYVSECIDIYMEEGDIIAEKTIFSGKAVSVEKFNSKPAIVTIPPKLFDPLPADESRSGEVTEETINVPSYKSKITEVKEMESEGVNVEDAETIVSCGRGFKNKEDLEIAKELADLFKGQALGCSRPVSADLNWLSEEHWIGLSGHKVKPRLYIAVGISGQIQHIAGMRDSDIIVAVNKDPDALIFESADYGIVGDLYEVLPKLKEAVKKEIG